MDTSPDSAPTRAVALGRSLALCASVSSAGNMGGAALPHGLGWWLEDSLGTVPGTPEVLVTALSGYWCVCALAEISPAGSLLPQHCTSLVPPWSIPGMLCLPQDSGFFFPVSRFLASLHLEGVPVSLTVA